MANTSLRVAELDHASIKNNLIEYLRSQDEFSDYDFEGAGLSVLLDILAYNTHYMGFYANMDANESFLDTAKLRESVVSRSKELGYTPASRRSSTVKVNVTVTPSDAEDQDSQILTLERFTKFLARDKDGVNYQFVACDSNTAFKSANCFTFSDIFLKQGEVTTLQYLMESTNSSRRFNIPSKNLDISTIRVSVQNSPTDTETFQYEVADDITEILSTSKVFWVEENEFGEYTVQFGDDVIGKKPPIGSVIIITYLETEGSEANKISDFFLSDSVGGMYNDNVIVQAANSSYGGSERETIDQTRFRAPRWYTTQNRALNVKDYEILILKDYPNIDSVSVWGGEDNSPKVYGKTYLSLKTIGNYQLTNLEKERIKTELLRNRNVVTVTPEIVDPEYVYLMVKGTINYNPSLTRRTASEIITLVKAAISDYSSQELNKFNSTFRKSRLQRYIEDADASILGSDISIYAQKRIYMESGTYQVYDMNFNMALKKGDYKNKMYSSPFVTSFDSSGTPRDIYFEEKPFSETGIDDISVINAGKNYLTAPIITISGDGTGAEAEAVVRGGKIYEIKVTSRGSNYTRATVTITGEGTEGRALAQLQAKYGTIRTFYYTSGGEKVIINENAGTINYETGEIYLNSFTSRGTEGENYYGVDYVTFNFPADKEMLLPLRNRILSIDENDPLSIQLNAVVES